MIKSLCHWYAIYQTTALSQVWSQLFRPGYDHDEERIDQNRARVNKSAFGMNQMQT